MSKAKTTQKKTATKNTLKKKAPNAKCGKCRKTKKHCKCGRPLFDGKDEQVVLQKLETAYALGSTAVEAIFHANISKTAYYDYLKLHPEFLDRIEIIKAKPTLQARMEVIKGLSNDPEFALKYLERKAKSEFAPSFTGIIDDGRSGGVLTEERKAEIAGALHNWEDDDEE